MTTNLIATVLTLLTTNVSENIEQQPVHNWNYAIPLNLIEQQRWSLPVSNPIKHVITEVHEQRLLILEAEGITFTNVLASTRKLRKTETYKQVIAQPAWGLDEAATVVETNWPAWDRYHTGWATNSVIRGVLILTNSNVTNPFLK